MGAGLIQLVATGIPDLYLTGDPQITWFKIMYRRYTEFSMQDHPLRLDGDLQLGSTHLIKIPPMADKLNRVALVADIPVPDLKMKVPNVQNVSEIVNDYDVDLVFNPPKRPTDKVTYEDLFNESDTSLGSAMVKKTKLLDTKYEARLDVLEFVRDTYSVFDGERIGRFIALKAVAIDFTQFGTNIDPQGYLMLTHEKTKELILSPKKMVNLDELSFVYRARDTTYPPNSPYPPNFVPDNVPRSAQNIPSRMETSDMLAKVYPRAMEGFVRISSLDDVDPSRFDTTNKKYHIILSIDSLRKIKERNILLRTLYQDLVPTGVPDEEESSIRKTDLNIEKRRKLMFNNFNYVWALQNSDFELGYYEFPDNQTVLEEDYPVLVETQLNKMRIRVPLLAIDQARSTVATAVIQTTASGASNRGVQNYTDRQSDVQIDRHIYRQNNRQNDSHSQNIVKVDKKPVLPPSSRKSNNITRNVIEKNRSDDIFEENVFVRDTAPNTALFNRYDVNENAIYDPTWEFSSMLAVEVGSTTVVNDQTIGSTSTDRLAGFWMIDVTKIDETLSNDTIDPEKVQDVLELESSQQLLVNPKYIYSVQDRLGFGPFTISKVWAPSITKNVPHIDPETNSVVVSKKKMHNVLDGVSALTKIFRDFYLISTVTNTTDDTKIIDLLTNEIGSVDIANLHNMLLSTCDDVDDDRNDSRNYRIDNIKLYNAVEIRSMMYKKLIKDIIYVDQLKRGRNLAQSITKFFRRTRRTIFNVPILDIYEKSFMYEPSSEPLMIHDRELIYDNEKFLMWSYYFEHIYSKYDPDIDNAKDIADDLKFLSYMLYYLPLNPTSLNPGVVSGVAAPDPATKNIRFARNKITNITDVMVYDDGFIENFENSHRSIGYNNSSVFLADYIYAGERFDDPATISSEKEFMGDDVKHTYPTGFRTCVNREVEFYHTIVSIDHSNIQINETVYDYFIRMIADAYDDPRNYLYTISFRTAEKFLRTYFKDINILNSSIPMTKVSSEIASLIVKTFNTTLLNYIKLIFNIWKNSTYSDVEAIPQLRSRLQSGLTFTEMYIDYDANYIKNELNRLFTEGSITQDQLNLGDPLKLRAKHFASSNILLRSFMGYSYKFNIDMSDSTSYEKASDSLIDTSNFVGRIKDTVSSVRFRDVLTDQIEVQTLKIEKDMEKLFKTSVPVVNGMNYVYWRDLNVYMRIMFDNINVDQGIPQSSKIHYYPNTAVMNHLPAMLTHYYGQHMQYIAITNRPKQLTNSSQIDNKNVFGNIEYDIFPIEDEDLVNQYKYDWEPLDTIEDWYLRYLGTDVRFDPKCPFHSKIDQISGITALSSFVDQYMNTNDLQYVQPGAFVTDGLCPLCFRTIAFRQLFTLILPRSVFGPNMINDRFKIVDDGRIGSLAPDSGELDSTLIKSDNPSQFVTTSSQYAMFLYRPGEVIYDWVSGTYFHIPTEFVVHRIAAILFRYRRMMMDILTFSDTDFETWITKHIPTPSQIGPPNIYNDTTEADRYENFVQYMRELRDPVKRQFFYDQMDRWVSILTHTDDNSTNFIKIKSIYDPPGPVQPHSTFDYTDYTEAISYIGRKNDLNDNSNTFEMVPNVFYEKLNLEKSGVNIVRFQTYRGNIALWCLLQRATIQSYNAFLNNVIDPREITTLSDLPLQSITAFINTPKTKDRVEEIKKYLQSRNLSPDIYNEIYEIFKLSIPDRYVNKNGTIDFYRSKETREYDSPSTSVVVNEFRDPISTNMINYCRQLMIYYNMLLVRYRKLNFLLKVKDVSLNSNAFYFNFSQNIAEGYLEDIRKTIGEMKIVDINPQNNKFISEEFYYPDTSRYFFINATTFRNKEINIATPELVNDYLVFTKDNNFHLRQTFTLNQLMNMMLMLGVHDKNGDVYDDYNKLNTRITQDSTDAYYSKISNGISVGFNNTFEKYVSVDQITQSLNNYDVYTFEDKVVYNVNTGYDFDRQMKKMVDDGLFNSVWYYLPTISNILYDQYYTPVTLKSKLNEDTTSNYFDFDTIQRRTYTKCMVTSPLVYMKNKMNHSLLSKHNHTLYLTQWEDDFHSRHAVTDVTNFGVGSSSALPTSTPEDDVRQMKRNEIKALRRLFGAYNYFAGSFGYTNAVTFFTGIAKEFKTGGGSLRTIAKTAREMIVDLLEKAKPAFELTNPQMRREHLALIITLEYSKMLSMIQSLVFKHRESLGKLTADLATIQTSLLNALSTTDSSTTQIVTDVNSTFAKLRSLFERSLGKANDINLTQSIAEVKQKILQINTITDLETIILRNINEVVRVVPIFEKEFVDITGGVTNSIQSVGTLFIKTNIDTRVYTPSALFTSTNLKLLHNFRSYKDVLNMILLDIIKFITPSDITIQEFLTYTSGKENFYNLTGVPVTAESVDNVFVSSIDNSSRANTFNSIVQNIKLAIHASLYPMSKLASLDRYIDTNKRVVDEFHRYDLDKVILVSDVTPSMSLTQFTSESYYDYKKRLITQRLKDPSTRASVITRNIRSKANIMSRRALRYNINSDTGDQNTLQTVVQPYVGSDVYTQIVRLLLNKRPKHAWVRYLGFRMIEEVALLIDGEQITVQDGDLMLLLHKTMSTVEHERGDNLMLGHVPEMYTISDELRPAMRLYIQFPLFFGKDYGNSLPLVNMLYSDVQLKIKLRPLEDLLYIERGGELVRPIKLKTQVLGNFIYLGDDERRTCALTKSESLMERFTTTGSFVRGYKDLIPSMLTDYDKATNVLKIRYHFEDPCKYLLWKVEVVHPDSQESDKIHWDLSNYRVRRDVSSDGSDVTVSAENLDTGLIDTKSKIIETVNRVMFEFNGKTREQWKQPTYYQYAQPYNKCMNALDSGEGLYSLCLFPKMLQPTGATNMSQLETMTLNMEINSEIANMMKMQGLKLKITMWSCAYNVFVAMSGFGALRFYGSR
ncbi:NCLDV major capsid protein [Yasminevirus sp. GU-2018]|uniref:NCLDV major capsid protein n=1 Tax=Yasminevirus sp. GU-2018 TaxID=2420051 RepID=A0A5K0U821_9VIRU|nr:NCLDV major capsid protein [Yasminevirus sp. GU-2018]